MGKWEKVRNLLNKLPEIEKWYRKTLTESSNILEKDTAIALAMGLIHNGSFRVGNKDSSEEEDPSFGLSQLRQSHLKKLTPNNATFFYRSKKGAKETIPTMQKKVITDKLLVSKLKEMKEATAGNFSCGKDKKDKNLFCFIDDDGVNKPLNTGKITTKMRELGTIASTHNFRHANANIIIVNSIKNNENYRQGVTKVAKQLGHMRVLNGEKVFDVGNTAEGNYILPEVIDRYGKGHYGRNHTYDELGMKRRIDPETGTFFMRNEKEWAVWKKFLTQKKTPIIKVKDEWGIK